VLNLKFDKYGYVTRRIKLRDGRYLDIIKHYHVFDGSTDYSLFIDKAGTTARQARDGGWDDVSKCYAMSLDWLALHCMIYELLETVEAPNGNN
jgi:hypothetical protein